MRVPCSTDQKDLFIASDDLRDQQPEEGHNEVEFVLETLCGQHVAHGLQIEVHKEGAHNTDDVELASNRRQEDLHDRGVMQGT